VLSGLAERGQAVGWVLRLSQSEAAQAVAKLMADHAMRSFSDTLQQLRLPLQPHRRAQRLAPGPPSALPAAETLMRRLREIVPEATAPALSYARRRLLAVGLGLHRASAWTRSPEFESALTSFEMHEFVSPDERQNAALVLPDEQQSAARVLPDEQPSAARVLPDEQQNRDLAAPQKRSNAAPPPADAPEAFLPEAIEVDDWSPVPVSPRLIQTGPPSAGADASQPASGHVAFERWHDDGGGPRPGRLPRTGGSAMQAPGSADLVPASIEVGEALVPILSPRSVQTAFGGILYLLNVALALGLYGDFAQPRTPGIALSPWDWLALIGRAWFGSDFACDAVWLLLAELAGRQPNEYPGYGFAPPEDWSVPAEWLEPWGQADVVRVYATRQRLQLWHDAGFLISDNPRVAGTAPLRQACAECIENGALCGAGLLRLRHLPHRRSRRALGRWMQYTILYLEARLARALGDGASAAIPTIVCRHSARLVVRATVVEIHLSLADLPIQIRLAGLDRNPGWIPAAGRSVVFYFA
jgi:hypothetical protein